MMHLEVCVEDASGKILVDQVLARLLRQNVSWRVHSYKGIGRIPRGLKSTDNAEKRILLDNLPKLIRGCVKTPYVSALIVVVDNDRKNCVEFLAELKAIRDAIDPAANVIFRIAIEEMEAWLLGDAAAIEAAYPVLKRESLNEYVPDSIGNTWERLADIIHPGGSAALISEGWPAPGKAKCEWAENIPPHMNFEGNSSPSFNKFLEALLPFR